MRYMSVAELIAEPLRTGLSRAGSLGSGQAGLTLSSVRNGRLDLTATKPIDLTDSEEAKYQVKPGAFYVVRGNGRLNLVGRGGLAPDVVTDQVAFPDLLIEVVPDQSVIDSRYLALVWNEGAVRAAIERRARTSAGIYKINLVNLRSVRVPVPSLDKQRHIAADLSAQLQIVDRARTKATESALESQRLLEMALARRIVTRPESGWIEVKLRDVVQIQLGKMLSPASKTGTRPVPYLRNANVQWDRFDLAEVYDMDFTDAEERKFRLEPGDVLVCEGGEPGRAAIWAGEIERCCYQKALHRLRPIADAVDPRFLMYRLWLGALRGEFTDDQTATTIAHLPAVRLANLKVRLPSVNEQRRIAAALREELASIEALGSAIRAEQEAIEGLPAALLRRAFRDVAA